MGCCWSAGLRRTRPLAPASTSNPTHWSSRPLEGGSTSGYRHAVQVLAATGFAWLFLGPGAVTVDASDRARDLPVVATTASSAPETQILPDCNGGVELHPGKFWVRKFGEAPRQPAGDDKVAYSFDVCWVRAKELAVATTNEPCQGEVETHRSPSRESLKFELRFYHSRATAPEAGSSADVVMRGQEIRPGTGEHLYGTAICRSATTRPLKVGRRRIQPAWIHAVPEAALLSKEFAEENPDRDDDFMMARPDLTVTPGTFNVEQKNGKYEVQQQFKICSGAGDADAVTMALTVGKSPGTKKTPANFNRFVQVGDVAARKCKTITHPFYSAVGPFRGFATIDENNAIEESRETNNRARFDYNVVVASASTPGSAGGSRETPPPGNARARQGSSGSRSR